MILENFEKKCKEKEIKESKELFYKKKILRLYLVLGKFEGKYKENKIKNDGK